MIRLPEIPGLSGTQINAPAMRPAAAAAPAEALGHVAQAIADVSDQFHATALHVQKLENARAVSEARRTLATDYAAHQLALQEDPDPASRLTKTAAFLSGYKGKMDSPDLPPAVRDELVDHFDAFATEATIRQAQDSATLATKRAYLAMNNEVDSAPDGASAHEAIRRAQEAGVILPEEADAKARDIDRNLEFARIDGAIEEDPALVLDLIQSGKFQSATLTPDDIPRIRRAAEAGIQRKRSDQLDLIEAALIEDKLEPDDLEAADYLTPKDRAHIADSLAKQRRASEISAIDTAILEDTLKPADLEAAQYLTPHDLARAKHALALRQAPDTSGHSQAWDALFKLREAYHNPALTDTQYAAVWNSARSYTLSLLPKGYQGDIAQELSYRSPANRDAGKKNGRQKPDVEEADKRTLATARVKATYDQGLFGDVTDPKSPSARLAYTRFEDARLEVNRFIRANPDAPYQQIRDHIAQTVAATLADGKPLIRVPAAPAPVSFDTRATRLLGLPEEGGEASDELLGPIVLPPP